MTHRAGENRAPERREDETVDESDGGDDRREDGGDDRREDGGREENDREERTGGRPCPLCEAPMDRRHCKYVCPRHGVVYDCADTFWI